MNNQNRTYTPTDKIPDWYKPLGYSLFGAINVILLFTPYVR